MLRLPTWGGGQAAFDDFEALNPSVLFDSPPFSL